MGTVKIYYLRQDKKIEQQLFRDFLSKLPESFQTEIAAYKHQESAQSSLLGKMLLLYGLRKRDINYSLRDLKVGYKDRPYLEGNVDFNISHSGEYVIVAIAKDMKVGIDIEKHRKLDVHLFRKYFDEEEWQFIEASDHPMQTFFDLWATKESAIKCDGRGVEVLSDTHVIINGQRMKPEVSCGNKTFYFEQLQTDPLYACSVCMEKKQEIHLEHLTISALKALK